MDEYKMKCPWCQKIFTLTDSQRWDNAYFRCGHCNKVISGSVEQKDGVLIGIKLKY